jgi:hypothetical protein
MSQDYISSRVLFASYFEHILQNRYIDFRHIIDAQKTL